MRGSVAARAWIRGSSAAASTSHTSPHPPPGRVVCATVGWVRHLFAGGEAQFIFFSLQLINNKFAATRMQAQWIAGNHIRHLSAVTGPALHGSATSSRTSSSRDGAASAVKLLRLWQGGPAVVVVAADRCAAEVHPGILHANGWRAAHRTAHIDRPLIHQFARQWRIRTSRWSRSSVRRWCMRSRVAGSGAVPPTSSADHGAAPRRCALHSTADTVPSSSARASTVRWCGRDTVSVIACSPHRSSTCSRRARPCRTARPAPQ